MNTSKQLKISVVIPVYNVEKYLAKCLHSILAQDLRDIELIAVNDGSTDSSLDILKSFASKDCRIKIIDKNNAGTSSARNDGIRAASGEYITFVDSDDWVDQGYLSEIYNFARENNLDVVISDIYYEYSADKLKYAKDMWALDKTLLSSAEWVQEWKRRCVFLDVTNKLFRKELFRDNGIYFPEDLKYGESAVVTPMIMSSAQYIGKIDKAFYHYLQRENSTVYMVIAEERSRALYKAFALLTAFSRNNNYDWEDDEFINANASYVYRVAMFSKDEQALKEFVRISKIYHIKTTERSVNKYAKILHYCPSMLLARFFVWMKNIKPHPEYHKPCFTHNPDNHRD